MTKRKIELEYGKYTIINGLEVGEGLQALRYGEEWRNLAGDGLVLAMYHEIERLRDTITWGVSCVQCTNQLADDWKILRGSFYCRECGEIEEALE